MADRQNPQPGRPGASSGPPPRAGYRAGGAKRLAAGAGRRPYKRPRPAGAVDPARPAREAAGLGRRPEGEAPYPARPAGRGQGAAAPGAGASRPGARVLRTPPRPRGRAGGTRAAAAGRRTAASPYRARRAGAGPGRSPAARPLALPRPVLFGLAALACCLLCCFGVWLARGPLGPAAPAQTQPDGEWPAQVGDTLRQGPAERVVSLSPMATEALLSLPGRAALAGVTEYCDARGLGLPTVGTPLLPDPEEILALSPDVVVCQAPLAQELAARLSAQGVELVTLPTPADLAGLREYYAQLGALLHGAVTGRAEGGAVIDRFTETLARYEAAIGAPVTALLLPDLSGLAATADTAEWAVLGRLFRHPAPQAEGWLLPAGEGDGVTEPDALAGLRLADPDLLLLPDTIGPQELEAAGLADLRAAAQGRVVYLDLRLVETMSPRLIRPLADAANLAYPDLAPPAPAPEPEG